MKIYNINTIYIRIKDLGQNGKWENIEKEKKLSEQCSKSAVSSFEICTELSSASYQILHS